MCLAPDGSSGGVQVFRKGKPHVHWVIGVIDLATNGRTASVVYDPSSVFSPLLKVIPFGPCSNCRCNLRVDFTGRERAELLTALRDVPSFNGVQGTSNLVPPRGTV